MNNLTYNQETKLNNQIEILSFKRKSDNKIFSIGDKFKWFVKGTINEDSDCGSQDQTFTGVIKEFKILGGECNIMHLHKFSNKVGSKVIKGSNRVNLHIDYLI